MSVIWSPEGAEDFLSALAYLRARNPVTAERLSNRVDEALRRLDELPIDGPERELANGRRVRTWPIPPLRAYYQRQDDDLLVVRLYHQRRESIEKG